MRGMTSPENKRPEQYSSLTELLLVTSQLVKALEEEARQKLHAGDPQGYAETVRQRAQLIADTPDAVSAYLEQGGEAPVEVVELVMTYASFARQVMDTGSTFGMARLLEPMGTEVDDPNLFDRLAYGMQPPNVNE